jgi:hypothetical protein
VPHLTGAYSQACYHCGHEGHFCRECPKGGQSGRKPRLPLGPCPLCKGNHWRSKCPHLQMEGGVPPPMDWWDPGPPVKPLLFNINVGEPQASIIVGKWKVIFLPFSPGPQYNNKFIVWVISSQLLQCYFTWPLACSWGDLHFCHSFLTVLETPVPLLGWDLLSQILFPPGNYLCYPLVQEQVDPTVWTDGMTVGWAKMALPIQIKLKDSLSVSTSKQYPLKPEGGWGFLPIINSLKKQGLLISCSSPYNILFLLSVRGQTNECWFKISSSLMKQSFPSTQLFLIYSIGSNTLKSPILLCTRFKECFLLHSSASWQSASVCLWRPC